MDSGRSSCELCAELDCQSCCEVVNAFCTRRMKPKWRRWPNVLWIPAVISSHAVSQWIERHSCLKDMPFRFSRHGKSHSYSRTNIEKSNVDRERLQRSFSMHSNQVRRRFQAQASLIRLSLIDFSTTQQTKTKTGVYESKGRYFLAHNSLTDVSACTTPVTNRLHSLIRTFLLWSSSKRTAFNPIKRSPN